MDLATLQRQLRDLIKGTYQAADTDHPYLRALAGSPHVALVQEIIASWRVFSLTQFCRLTTAVLQHRDLLKTLVPAFIRATPSSPFMEEFGTAFLQAMSVYPDSLIASVAQFELALIRVQQGNSEEHVVTWEYDPTLVLRCLLYGQALNESQARGLYQTIVAQGLPGRFRVIDPGSPL
jgi:hypothetical protein